MFERSSPRPLEWRERTVAIGNIFKSLSSGRGPGTPREWEWFGKSLCPLSVLIQLHLHSFNHSARSNGRSSSSNVLIIQWRHSMKKSVNLTIFFFFSFSFPFFFFTEGTRESRRTLNIAIRQLGSPSPASGRLCPLFRDRAELRWWPPRELHLCRPRRQRWPVSHSTSSSPGRQR